MLEQTALPSEVYSLSLCRSYFLRFHFIFYFLRIESVMFIMCLGSNVFEQVEWIALKWAVRYEDLSSSSEKKILKSNHY